MKERTIYRSCKNRIIGGVAGGLGEYFEIDPVLIRLIFVLLTIAGGAGILVYLIAWLIVPEDPSCATGKSAKEEIREKTEEFADKTKKILKQNKAGDGKTMVGLIIVAFGLIILFQNLFQINLWHNFWPILLIIVGLAFILSTRERA